MKRIFLLFFLTFGQITLFAQQYTSEDIPGVFSVSQHKKVIFSKGNLQACYDGSEYHWRFAAHQYEYIGDAPGNTTIGSPSKGEIIDLFSWSTENNYYGICNNEDMSNDAGKFRDWGMLIDDGEEWKTLGLHEWEYLYGDKSSRKVKDRMKYGRPCYSFVTISDSLMIDGIPCPSGLFLYPDEYNGEEIGDSGPVSWQSIFENGIVFLPSEGYRTGNEITNPNQGYYWSCDFPTAHFDYCKYSACYIYINPYQNEVGSDNLRRHYGRSVRLVRNYNHKIKNR